MFKIDELAGSLIKSGRFADAISVFNSELEKAYTSGVLTWFEMFSSNGLIARFNRILLDPSNANEVTKLGEDMIFIAIRIPGYVEKV